MDTERNKQIACEFFARLDRRDIDGALALLSEDATYWIAGRRDAIPTAGLHDKARIGRIFRRMDEQLKNGLRMAVSNVIAEGDQVAFEAQSNGELQDGRIYSNQYHMRMTLRDGLICAVKEYLDTQHVLATWFQPATA